MPLPIYVYILSEDKNVSSDEKIFGCVRLFLKAGADERGMVCPPFDKLPEIIRGDGKKPYFAKDIGVYFSVSHSGGFWVCSVSRQETGIDIQKKTREYDAGIAKRFFHPDEHAYLQDKGFDDFFSVWAAKESYVKYTGQGIDEGFSSFSVIKNGRITDKINGTDIRFLPFDSEYRLCLSAKKIDKAVIKG